MFDIGRKEQIILLVVAAVVIFGSGYKIAENKLEEKPQMVKGQSEVLEDEEKDTITANGADMVTQEIGKIFVHVSGAVLNPGLYELPEGSRVNNALSLAVVREDALLENVNLAQILRDEDKIVVPDESQRNDPFFSETSNHEQSSSIVNINTANESQLQTLNGIGSVYAKNIVEYREQSGPFKTIEEIKNVSGIGDKRFENLKDSIVVN